MKTLVQFMAEGPAPGEVDHHVARELHLHADNTHPLQQQKHYIVKNLKRKMEKGTYNHSLAPKLWRYHVDNTVKSYRAEHAGPHFKVNTATRNHMANTLANDTHDEIKRGEWDHVSTKRGTSYPG